MKIYDAMSVLSDDIENWLRWLCDRTVAPARYVSLLGKVAVLRNREGKAETKRQQINIQEAERFEDIINELDERSRMAFRLSVVGVILIRGKAVRVRNKWHAARLMRISDRHYRRLLNVSLNAVVTRLGYVKRQQILDLSQESEKNY